MQNALRLLLALVALSFSGWSVAQWQWVDKDGRKIFSDRAPPPDIPEKSILKRPGKTMSEVPKAAEDAASAPEADSAVPGMPAPKASAVDKTLEAKKKQVAQAEADKRKAEQERIQTARAENCTRAKQAKMTYESDVKIIRTNAAGQREVLDDAARAAELQRIERIIAQDCAPR